MKQIIVKPLITEKTMQMAANGWFTFEADIASDKNQIAHNIESLYRVKVTSVRTMRIHGKARRSGKRMVKRIKPDWKKTLVRLKQGQTIEAFQITTQEAAK